MLYYSSQYRVCCWLVSMSLDKNMKQAMALLAIALLLGVLAYLYAGDAGNLLPGHTAGATAGQDTGLSEAPDTPEPEATVTRGVFDISVHSVEELEVLFDRAEELARRPNPLGGEDRIVLILHGPEVEFFAISNYDRYRDIVDRAARLDAFHVVDVRICQTMMKNYGIEADDVPAFIEQVPNGAVEVERLTRKGYIYF